MKKRAVLLAVLLFSVACGCWYTYRFKDIMYMNSDYRQDSEPELKENKDIKVNINTADEEELSLIPGIGGAISENITKYRQEHGTFGEKEALMNVEGIGEEKYKSIEKYIEVD